MIAPYTIHSSYLAILVSVYEISTLQIIDLYKNFTTYIVQFIYIHIHTYTKICDKSKTFLL